MFPDKKEDKILISLDTRENTDYLNSSLCREMDAGKQDAYCLNDSMVQDLKTGKYDSYFA